MVKRLTVLGYLDSIPCVVWQKVCWEVAVVALARVLEFYSKFAVIVSIDYRFLHNDFNRSSCSSFKQSFYPSTRAIAVCSRELSLRDLVHLRTIAFRIDNVDFVAFSVKMFIRLSKPFQEFISTIRLLIDASHFLDETFRLTLPPTLLQYHSQSFFIKILIQTIHQSYNPLLSASNHF